MRMMTVADVMTRDVVTVGPDASYKEIVEKLIGGGISAVPVLDDHGALLGVVSEADLLRKEEHVDDEPGVGRPVLAAPHVRIRWRKAVADTARELMTSPVRTVSSQAALPNVARMLAQLRIRRLFVVDAGRLVGVVARRDLLRGFLRGDGEIREEIEREVFGRVLWATPGAVLVRVNEGVVTLSGRLEYQAEAEIAARLVKAIPGVVNVRDELDYRWVDEADRIRTR